MSLKPSPLQPVPKQTAQIARAAFPKGSVYRTLRDQLGTLFEDQHFEDLYPPQGQPAQAPWRLALVTLMQLLRRISQIDKPPTPCEAASTGSTPSGWN